MRKRKSSGRYRRWQSLCCIACFLLLPTALAQTVVLPEDFTNGIPNNWTILDDVDLPGVHGWTDENIHDFSFSNMDAEFAIVTRGEDSVSAHGGSLLTPELDVSGYGSVVMNCSIAYGAIGQTYFRGPATIDVRVNGGPWINLYKKYYGQWCCGDEGLFIEANPVLDVSHLVTGQVDVSIQFRFKHHGDWTSLDSYFAVDDVSITASEEPATPGYAFERFWPNDQQPRYFNNIKGIAADVDDSIYVVDAGLSRIVKMDVEGNFIKTWGGPGNEGGRFNDPQGIVVDKLGNVYIADVGNDRVQKFDSNGKLQEIIQHDFPESITDPFESHQVDAWGQIALDSLGNLYATTRAKLPFAEVHKYPPDINEQDVNSEVILLDHPDVETNFALVLTAITIDDTDTLVGVYGAEEAPIGLLATAIKKYNLDGSARLDESGDPIESASWDLLGARGVTSDSTGNIYVSFPDDSFNLVQVYSPDLIPIPASPTSDAFAIAVDKDDNIYGGGLLGVTRFDSSLNTIGVWDSADSAPGRFSNPTRVHVDLNGNVFVADKGNSSIKKFTVSGELMNVFPVASTFLPHDVVADPEGNMYVIVGNTFNVNLLKLAPGGALIFEKDTPYALGAPGGISENYDIAGGIDISDAGDLFVGGSRFDPDDGSLIETVVDADSDDVAVSIDGNDSLYIYTAHCTDSSVRKWDSSGTLVATYFANLPLSLDVDADQNIYIYELNGVRIINADGTLRAVFGDRGSAPGSFNHYTGSYFGFVDVIANGAAGIAVDADLNIYVADDDNDRIQKFVPSVGLSNAKAIVVAGGGPFGGNNLWDATQSSANHAVTVLTFQGFTKDRIQYLSADSELDLDGNGIADDVDGDATNANLMEAIGVWANAEPAADELVVYLVDHGGANSFRMNANELLDASKLNTYLSSFNGRTSIVVYDACQSGSFQSALNADTAGSGRLVITSTEADQNAHFLAAGAISFSNFFWSQIMNGNTVGEAYDFADASIKQNVNAQDPILEQDPNPVDPAKVDIFLRDLHIGNGTVVAGDRPTIGTFTADEIVGGADDGKVRLAATMVVDRNGSGGIIADGVDLVWAVFVPPDFEPLSPENPIIDLPKVSLEPGADNATWEVVTDAFSVPGQYVIALYARDHVGNISLPKPPEVALEVESTDRRRAVMVGTWGDGISESAVTGLMRLAYDALSSQGYSESDGDITFLATDVDNNIAETEFPAELGLLDNALDPADTRDLVLYLVGRGSAAGFEMNNGLLTPGVLAGWLTTLEAGLPDDGVVTLVLDFDGAGAFAREVNISKGSTQMIQVVSTFGGEVSFAEQGLVSYSQYFWSAILNGATVGQAHVQAAIALLDMGFYQNPRINDNGNALFNEPFDGLLAAVHRLGIGILYAGDAPVIGGLELVRADDDNERQLTGRDQSAVIRASGVTSTAGLWNVFATVVAPQGVLAKPNQPFLPFEIVALTDEDNDGVFEAEIGPLDRLGHYDISVIAVDVDNQVSIPKRDSIYQLGSTLEGGEAEPDEFEDDDTFVQAQWVGIGAAPRTHNFDVAGDEDWVMFFADADPDHLDPITIETLALGDGADTLIDVYFEDDFDNAIRSNDNAGEQSCALIRRSKISPPFYAPQTGYYFVKVTQSPVTCLPGPGFGPDTFYDLRIFRAIGECTGFDTSPYVIVTIKGDELSDRVQDEADATITISGGPLDDPLVVRRWGFTKTDEVTFTQIPLPEDGDYTITINALGFEPEQRDLSKLPCNEVYIFTDGSGGDEDAIELTPIPPPSVPENVSATTGTSGGTVVLNWGAVDDATSYKIFYSPSTKSTPASGTDVGNVTFKTISGLTPGVSYDFQVVAVNAGGESVASVSVSAVASTGPPPPCTGCNCPTKSAIEFLRLSIHEEVLPYDIESVEGATIGAHQAIAVRVLSGVAVQPDTVWISVEGSLGYAAVDNAWRPTTPGDHRDGWIVFEPITAYANDERLFVSAGARYEDGTEFGPVTYVFDVDASKAEASLDPYIDETEIDEPMPTTLAQPVSVPYNLGPLGVFAEPMTVRLPVPEGYTPDELAIYYYSDSERHLGWYPATGVVGFLAEGSRQTIIIDHMTYIEFTVHHGGHVQLGIPIQTQLATLAPLFVALLLAAIFQFTWKRRRTITPGIRRPDAPRSQWGEK